MSRQASGTTRRRLLAAAGAAAGGSLIAGTGATRRARGQTAGPPWSQANADAANTGALLAGSGPSGDVTRDWTADADYVHDGVAVVDEVVYVGGKALTALDTATGTEQWRFEPAEGERERYREGATPEFGTPAVGDGTVYAAVGFGSFDDHRIPREDFVAVDAATGAERWRFDPPDSRDFSDPSVADGLVYTRCGWADDREPTLFALRPDGSVAWEEPVARAGRPPVAVVDGQVYTATDAGVTALDGGAGSAQWTADGLERAAWAALVVAHGAVYVVVPGDGGAAVVALDRATGEERWRVGFAGDNARPEIGAVDEAGLYVQDPAGEVDVVAVDTDGTRRWEATVASGEDEYVPTDGLARAGEFLYAGATAIDPADGSVVWTRSMDEYVAYGLTLDAVAGGRAYLLGGEVVTLVGTGEPGTEPPATPTATAAPASPTATPRASPSATATERTGDPVGGYTATRGEEPPTDRQAGTETASSSSAPNATTTATAATDSPVVRGVGDGFGVLVTAAGVCGGLAAVVRARLRDGAD